MNVTLEDVRTILDLGDLYRFRGDEWSSYDATIVSRGRTYPVAQVTVYDDVERGLLLIAHYDVMRTKAQRDAWNRVTDMFDMSRPEPWQTPYRMAPALSH